MSNNLNDEGIIKLLLRFVDALTVYCGRQEPPKQKQKMNE